MLLKLFARVANDSTKSCGNCNCDYETAYHD